MFTYLWKSNTERKVSRRSLTAAAVLLLSAFMQIGARAEKDVPDNGIKELNVLMIGNSFSICVCNNLPQIVKNAPGCKLRITSLYIGGCSLKRHWENVEQTENNPDAMQYSVRTSGYDKPPASGKTSINSMVKLADWDVITIQQASPDSWNPETYQPYAQNLIEYIQKHSPKSKIMIQQTWAYRNDDPRIRAEDPNSETSGGTWGFSQLGMYNRLTDAYLTLAERNGFEIIPSGAAIQIARRDSAVKFEGYPEEDLKKYSWPDMPRQAGETVGSLYWKKDSKTGKMKLNRDTIHLNARGEYLQACVWFAKLFGEDPEQITYVPDNVGKTDAAFLRKCAAEAAAVVLKRR